MSTRTVVAVAFALFGCASCQKKGQPTPIGKLPPGSVAVTAQETDDYVKAMLQAYGTCDVPRMRALISVDTMIQRSAAASKMSRLQAKFAVAGAMESADETVLSLCTGNHFRLVTKRTVGEETSVVFRVDGESADDGFSYLEQFIAKSTHDGRVRAYETLDYMTGQRLSEQYKELFDVAMRDSGKVDAFAKAIDDITAAMEKSEWSEAKSVLAGLDKNFRDNRSVMSMDLRIATNMGDEAYLEAMARYAALFPDDPSLDLVSIDAFWLQKKYDKALASIDRLDARVGGDPQLDVVRGQIYAEKGDYTSARTRLEAAIVRDPKNADAKYALLETLLALEDFTAAVATMTSLRDDHGETFSPELATTPEFATFAKSKAGADFFAHASQADNVKRPVDAQ